MWDKIADYILKHRVLNLTVILLIFIYMFIRSIEVKMAYSIATTLPDTDSTMIVYHDFIEKYGPDGLTVFVGMTDDKLFTLSHFQNYYDFTEKIRNMEGVTECLSVARIYNLKKNDSLKRFELSQVVPHRPQTQQEVDAIHEEIMSLALYDGLLFNTEKHSALMLVSFDNEHVSTKLRGQIVENIRAYSEQYGIDNGVAMHVSGMPYIRELTTRKMVFEIIFFTILAVIVAGIILYVFFRSWRTLVSVMALVGISVGIMFGLMVLLGFDVTILTGVLPPLLIIIGVENSIFMLNKYHSEYEKCGDKMEALRITIKRIGPANLLTNATTAVSFAAFIITRNELLVPFGITASVSIMLTYVMTMILLPTFFSYQKAPTESSFGHLNHKFIDKIVEKVTDFVLSHRSVVYIVSSLLLVIMMFGASMMTTSGRVVDDIAKSDKLYKDIMYFEENVGGVLPFEISIDTRKPKGVANATFINKIQQMQDTLALYKEFSQPLSVAEVVKFARQAFYNGNRKDYKVPNNNEFTFLMKYLPKMKDGSMPGFFRQYIDEDMRNTRISVQMANVTTPRIDEISKALSPAIDQIFPKEKYDVVMTGSATVTLKGTTYLLHNLVNSLILAFVVIAILMIVTFKKLKIVVVSLIPNLVPLVFTAGMMGFCGIPLKMSTLLIFSVALGISVDNTIHYLSRYRLQLRYNEGDIRKSVKAAIAETVPSMIYSASILISGFLIFAFSSFGGTKIVGFLVPFTLFIALITNMLVLPSLVMTFNRKNI